jgi:hypothetical protein
VHTVFEHTSDGGGLISEEILSALELDSMPPQGDYFLSVSAMSGSQSRKVVHLRGLVNNQVLSILVESGSSHTFVNAAMLGRLQCRSTPTSSMIVKVASGHTLISDQEVKNFEWWIQGFTF